MENVKISLGGTSELNENYDLAIIGGGPAGGRWRRLIRTKIPNRRHFV